MIHPLLSASASQGTSDPPIVSIHRFVTDNELLADYNGFRTYHDSITGDLYLATVLASLDLHFRHTVVMLLSKQV